MLDLDNGAFLFGQWAAFSISVSITTHAIKYKGSTLYSVCVTMCVQFPTRLLTFLRMHRVYAVNFIRVWVWVWVCIHVQGGSKKYM